MPSVGTIWRGVAVAGITLAMLVLATRAAREAWQAEDGHFGWCAVGVLAWMLLSLVWWAAWWLGGGG